MAWAFIDQFKLKQENGNAVDLDAGSGLKVALLKSTWTPAPTTDALFSSISSNEVSGSNYTAGGNVLASTTASVSSGTFTFDAADPTWLQHASGFTNARYAVIYEVSSSKIVVYADFGADKGNVSGDLTLVLDALGIFTKA